MKVFLVSIAISCMFFMSCKQEQALEGEYLRNGYRYVNYTNNPGKRPVVGEVVSIDFDIIDEFGNNLSDSRNANIRPTVMIPQMMDYQTKRNPLLSLIQMMTEKDSASVFVPVDSLSSPPSHFLQSEMVEYRVVVHHIESEKEYMKRVGAEEQRVKNESLSEAQEALDMYKSGQLDDFIVTKNGEVKLAIVNNTEGVTADYDELVFVHYYGFLKNGEVFDSSYKVGKPYGFEVGKGKVIQGWDIAIPDIPEGATAIIDIPNSMAYGSEGKQGVIPPNSDLIYWVKIDHIQKSKKVTN